MPIFYSKSEDKKQYIYTFKTKASLLAIIAVSLLVVISNIFAAASNNTFFKAMALLVILVFIVITIVDYLPIAIRSWKAVASKKKRVMEQSGGFFSDYTVRIEK